MAAVSWRTSCGRQSALALSVLGVALAKTCPPPPPGPPPPALAGLQMERGVADALAGGCQEEDCRLRLDHAVTVHAYGAGVANHTEYGTSIKSFLHSSAKFAALAPLGQLAGQLLL